MLWEMRARICSWDLWCHLAPMACRRSPSCAQRKESQDRDEGSNGQRRKGGGDRLCKCGAGCEGVAAINTIQSVMGINLDTLRPEPSVEGHSTPGGYSCKAIKPIALAKVIDRQVARARHFLCFCPQCPASLVCSPPARGTVTCHDSKAHGWSTGR